MSVFELKADLRRRLKLVRDELAKPLPEEPLLVLVYRPDSTNAGVTTAGAFLSNYVGDQLWKTDDYGTAEARIQKYNLRFTSVVTYQAYLKDCEANLTEILENL
mgnify:FL=1